HTCQIKQLKLQLNYQHEFYFLINRLPLIEYLYIELCKGIQNGEQDHYQNHYENIPTLLKLKEFVFCSSEVTNYTYLELFISLCSNLQHLSLNLASDQSIDGHRLEQSLLKLSKLIKFNFCIDNPMTTIHYIETYQTSYWLENYAIISFRTSVWRNRQCIFSLPYSFSKFYFGLNDMADYQTNVNYDDILMYSKRNMTEAFFISDNKPFTLKFFQFIKQICGKTTKLTINSYAVNTRLDDDLMNNNDFVLINVVYLKLSINKLEFKYLKRLLLMTPNVQQLEMLWTLSMLILDLKTKYYLQLQPIFSRIRHVHIF
ncbi:unnamed protein product, partial [Didymodactylos carnosus]